MGSITSFIVLCIANAAMSRFAYEEGNRKGTPALLKDCPILVNGDDLLMRCNQKTREMWKTYTSFVGLEESIGKTYYSNEFAQINSTNFIRLEDESLWDLVPCQDKFSPSSTDDDRHDWSQTLSPPEEGKVVYRLCPFIEVGLVNMGLMYGLKRSQGLTGLADLDSQYSSLGSQYRDLIDHSPQELRSNVHKKFVDHHRELLDGTKLPWFIPEWLGGLGLTGVVSPSQLDRRIAKMIVRNWEKKKPIVLKQPQPWATWMKAEQALPKPKYTTVKCRQTEEYTSFVGMKCIDLLFDNNITLKDMKEINEENNKVTKAIRHNERLWQPSNWETICGDEMTDEEMKYQSKYPVFNEPIITMRLPVADLD